MSTNLAYQEFSGKLGPLLTGRWTGVLSLLNGCGNLLMISSAAHKLATYTGAVKVYHDAPVF